MAKFCGRCGAPLEEGIKFCAKCGAPVDGQSQASVMGQLNLDQPSDRSDLASDKNQTTGAMHQIREVFFNASGRLDRQKYFKYFLIVFAFSFVGAILGNLDITALTLLGALVQLVGTVAHVLLRFGGSMIRIIQDSSVYCLSFRLSIFMHCTCFLSKGESGCQSIWTGTGTGIVLLPFKTFGA